MLKKLITFLIGSIPEESRVELIKEQLKKNAPKLTAEQKQAILAVAKEMIKAAAAGAVSGAVSK
jgi:hypothetical protein